MIYNYTNRAGEFESHLVFYATFRLVILVIEYHAMVIIYIFLLTNEVE